jgi:hypothetical protein
MEAVYSDSIGTIGGFVLPDGSVLRLTPDDIGTPERCSTTNSDMQETFTTNIDLDDIPLGTPYAWSPSDNCWYYMLDNGVYYNAYLLRALS